jgi:hypothetical protein
VLTLVDCLSGAVSTSGRFPQLLNASDLHGRVVAIEFRCMRDVVVLSIAAGFVSSTILVNGTPLVAAVSLPPGDVFTLQFGTRLLLLQVNAPEDWPRSFDPTLWNAYDIESGELLGQAAPYEIPAAAASQGWPAATCAIYPGGLDSGFLLADVAETLSARATPHADPAPRALSAGILENAETGKYLCPACWLRFDAGDAFNIATHESLRGDPVLGDNAMLRFYPARFNDSGQALDPKGLPSTDLACPHCRRQLPPGYLDLSLRIFSLIGAPSAGKSYFLAVLTRVLAERLYQDFGIVFKDGDPSGNTVLNQMRTRLFSGSTPEECALGKTAMEGGATYELLLRHGRVVAMPRPFIYTLGDGAAPGAGGTAMIFYDNAGEHFEPGHDMVDKPGALHVAHSSGIFFLFDPTSNLAFRRALLGHASDPQLSQNNQDQQDGILAEMEVRVKKMLALGPREKLPVPVAFLVGKCDVWQGLLDARTLPRPVRDGVFDPAIVDQNSAQVRAMFARLCPGLVAQAESLSEDVRYFAISSLGHSPFPISSGECAGMLAPDPRKLAPIGIEAPAYWLLHKAVPALLPTA